MIVGGGTGKIQKFDETKSQDANNVEKIVIDTKSVNVNISTSMSSEVEAHFYGKGEVDGEVNFEVSKVNRELRIILDITGICYNSNLQLDITVPSKTFKTIFASSSSANINLSESVSVEHLKLKTKSGNLETRATFTNASIDTMSGDVELYIDANKDISAEIATMSGGVATELKNIGQINLYTSSMSGDIRIQ